MAKFDEFVLDSGRRLYLKELRQYLTYEGLLEGLPTAERNQRRLAQLTARHDAEPYPGPPYLIPPIEVPIDAGEDKPYRFGTPSALPAVTCIGRFTSFNPARNTSSDYSGLVVVWFQEEFAFPIDPDQLGQMLRIDWERHAIDLDY